MWQVWQVTLTCDMWYVICDSVTWEQKASGQRRPGWHWLLARSPLWGKHPQSGCTRCTFQCGVHTRVVVQGTLSTHCGVHNRSLGVPGTLSTVRYTPAIWVYQVHFPLWGTHPQSGFTLSTVQYTLYTERCCILCIVYCARYTIYFTLWVAQCAKYTVH